MTSLFRRNKRLGLEVAGGAALILLAACQGAPPTTPAAASPTTIGIAGVSSTQTQPANTQAQPIQTEPGAEDASETAMPGQLALELGFELGDPNLRASDANAFNAASAGIQFVEFFAFW